MSDIERITDLWWAGVRLWYNENDFLGAMQVWDEAVGNLDDDTDDATSILPKETSNSSTASFLAPLIVFLAGCYLDAGDIQKARLLCRRCLATKAFQENDALAFRAVSEYCATFQEDENVSEPWKIAYQMAEWTIQTKRQSATGETSSCWKDPYQRPGFYYPSLVSKPIYKPDEHPNWCKPLEAHFLIIREEYQQLLHGRGYYSSSADSDAPQHWPRVGAGEHREGAGQHDASVVGKGGDWREIVLFGSGARPELAPKTCRLLEKYAPEAVDLAQEGAGEIIFSVLAPSTHIAPHCASTNLRLTAHMGLQIPSQDDSQCYIQVGNEKLCWEEGRFIVFDDSYQHEVHNCTKEIRTVLLLRFWHPNLKKSHRQQALQHVFRAKEIDRERRFNPPLPPDGAHNPQGMNQQMCSNCGRSGYETVRLVRPEDALFVCLCGKEVPQ